MVFFCIFFSRKTLSEGIHDNRNEHQANQFIMKQIFRFVTSVFNEK